MQSVSEKMKSMIQARREASQRESESTLQIIPPKGEVIESSESSNKTSALDNILHQYRDRKQFVNWRIEIRDDRKIKLPINPVTLKNAKSNDPATWNSYALARKNVLAGKAEGIGYMMMKSGDDYLLFIDVDHCICENGEIKEKRTRAFLDFFNGVAYIEYSMSKTGLHIIARVKKPSWMLKSKYSYGDIGFEFYDSGRFCALTGNLYQANDTIAEIDQVAFDDLIDSQLPDIKSAFESRQQKIAANKNNQHDLNIEIDDNLIEHFCKIDSKFNSAFRNGDASFWRKADGSPDPSDRDFYVTCYLCWLSNGDRDWIESQFRQSACMHDVAERKSNPEYYINLTIDNTINEWDGDCYTGRGNKKSSAGMGGTRDGKNEFNNNGNNYTGNIEENQSEYQNPEIALDIDVANFFSCDDTHAELLVTVNPDLKIVTDMGGEKGTLLQWDGARFNSIKSRDLYPDLKSIAREVRSNITDSNDEISKSINAELKRSARRLSSNDGKEQAIFAAGGLSNVQLKRKQLNQNRYLFPCVNGYIDLSGENCGRLIPADPRELFTLLGGASYLPESRSELWEKTVREIMPDDQARRELQKFIGYSLLGDPFDHKFSYCYGTGGNGKSFLWERVAAVFGDWCHTVEFNLFSASLANRRDANSHSAEIAKLEFARLVLVSEIAGGVKLDNATVKKMTGGDRVTARAPFDVNPIEYRPQYSINFTGNEKIPFATPQDDGIDRRMLFFVFLVRFAKANKDLARLLDTPENLSGILTWIVEGLQNYYIDGKEFHETTTMREGKDEVLNEGNFVEDFIEENCEYIAGERIKLKEFIRRVQKSNPKLTAKSSDIERLLDKNLQISIEKDQKDRTKFIIGIRFKMTQTDFEYQPVIEPF